MIVIFDGDLSFDDEAYTAVSRLITLELKSREYLGLMP